MKIEALRDNDLHLVRALQPDGWSDIQPAFEYYTRSAFCFPIKVTLSDTIVGIGTTILHNDVAWLGHIIVHKDFRRKGIGLFITQGLVESLSSNACETIYLLATDLGAPVYEKAGFVSETEYLFFKDIELKKTVTGDHIQPYHAMYKEQVAGLDLMTSGEERFFHLEEYLDDGYLYLDKGRVRGFYLPGFGDGLVIADDPGAGLSLLQKRMEKNDKLVFPKDNSVATRFIYEHGWKEVSTGKRMRLGKKRHVNFTNIYSRIGGNLG